MSAANSVTTEERAPRPIAPTPNFDNIPAELKSINRWVLWRYEWVIDKQGEGHWSKVPYQPGGSKASTTNQNTWVPFKQVKTAYENAVLIRQRHKDGETLFDGAGFVLVDDDDILAFDFDHVLVDGVVVDDDVARWLDLLNSYTEVTPSGTGFRVFCFGKLPPKGRRRGDYEVYSGERYLTLTGQIFGDPRPIEHRQAEIDQVHQAIFGDKKAPSNHTNGARLNGSRPATNLNDTELLDKARRAKDGAKFTALYDRGAWQSLGYKSPSEADLALADLLAFWTGADGGRIDTLFRNSALMREKWNRADIRESIIAKATARTETYQARASNGHAGAPRQPETASGDAAQISPRPSIEIKAGEAPRMMREAEEALIPHAAKRRLFQRSGEITRVITLDQTREEPKKKTAVRRAPGAVVLRPATESNIVHAFEEVATWEAQDKRSKKSVIRDCPAKLAKRYLEWREWNLPVLAGVIEAPLIKPDGDALTHPGYDPATGLYFATAGGWDEIAQSPSKEDAAAALALLREPFKQFPHTTGSCSVLISTILTALQRRLLPSAPLTLFTAPRYRAGKTLQAEAVGIIATGRVPAAAAYSASAEEVRKLVLSILRQGDSVVLLDNVDVPVESGHLARALTQDTYSDRLLGVSENLQLSTRVTWLLTANNPSLRRDITVRVLEDRVDPDCENPEERTFDIPDLRGHLLKNRRDLVKAAMTILRAWHVAGKPKMDCPAWGGFDEWSRQIREPLIWLGMDDPYISRRDIIEDDPGREGTIRLFDAWHSQFGQAPKKIADIIKAANEALCDEFLAVAADRVSGDRVNAKRLGNWLSAHKDAVIGNYKLFCFKSSNHPAQWAVSKR